MLFLQFMQVPQQMYPAALVLPRKVVVCCIKVCHQCAIEVRAEYALGYSPCPAVVVLIVPLTFWCTEKPDVAILSSLPPTGLVPMYDAALSHPLMNSFHCALHHFTLYFTPYEA